MTNEEQTPEQIFKASAIYAGDLLGLSWAHAYIAAYKSIEAAFRESPNDIQVHKPAISEGAADVATAVAQHHAALVREMLASPPDDIVRWATGNRN